MLMSCRDGQCRCADIGSLNAKGGKQSFGPLAQVPSSNAEAAFQLFELAYNARKKRVVEMFRSIGELSVDQSHGTASSRYGV